MKLLSISVVREIPRRTVLRHQWNLGLDLSNQGILDVAKVVDRHCLLSRDFSWSFLDENLRMVRSQVIWRLIVCCLRGRVDFAIQRIHCKVAH